MLARCVSTSIQAVTCSRSATILFIADADGYLLQWLSYLHVNAVRARMVKHPSDYPS